MRRAVILSLVLGLVSSLFSVLVIASSDAEPSRAEWSGADDGTHSWMFLSESGTGFQWVNVQYLPGQSQGGAFMEHLPAWARPQSPEPGTSFFFSGTLALGWPFPFLTRRWEDRGGGSFPPPAELDENHQGLKLAMVRFSQSIDLPATRLILPNTLLSLGVWTAGWLLVIALFRRIRRGTAAKLSREAPQVPQGPQD